MMLSQKMGRINQLEDDLQSLKHQLDKIPDEAVTAVEKIIQEMYPRLSEEEQRYVTAIVNPFNQYAAGCRIPNLVNDSTIAIKDHQSLQIQIGATGRALIFINYNMLSSSPIAIFNNLNITFNDPAKRID